MDEKNIFTSHYAGDNEQVKRLEQRLNDKQSKYKFRSSTIDEAKIIPSSNENVIRRGLRKKINWAGAFIVAVGKETHKRDWVNWEIEEASRLGKNIVGVYLHGQRDSEIPPALEKYGDALVGYNDVDKIIDSIEGEGFWDETRPSFIQMGDERRGSNQVGPRSKC